MLKKCLNAFLEAVKEALRNNEEVRLVGFGTFKVGNRKERKEETQEQVKNSSYLLKNC